MWSRQESTRVNQPCRSLLEPVLSRWHLAIGKAPASSLPFRLPDLKPLFAAQHSPSDLVVRTTFKRCMRRSTTPAGCRSKGMP